MGQFPKGNLEDSKNLSNTLEIISSVIRGRGISKVTVSLDKCICQRPYTHIICLNCGHLMFGRVRYRCLLHPMVTFLIDITNCPKCKGFEFMLDEIDVKSEQFVNKCVSYEIKH